MSVFAAVLTGKGTGAISTIKVFGDGAETVVAAIFEPENGKTANMKPPRVLLGTITKNTEVIDQVVIGCEAPGDVAINCHGNPLIVADIMQLLAEHGAELLSADDLTKKLLSAKGNITIAVEAKLTQVSASTLEGTKILAAQIETGLCKTAQKWLDNINNIGLEQIQAAAAGIIRNSVTARLIIEGCTTVIAGPPNSGKSTLLNCLCGRKKAIVTDIKGTTRDWLSAACRIGPLLVELIDTAGLDKASADDSRDEIDMVSQQRALELLGRADMVLVVLDTSEPYKPLAQAMLDRISNKRLLTILNKSDLPAQLDPESLPEMLSNRIRLSAKLGIGIEQLIAKIPQICGVTDFDLSGAVCFTARQKSLLERLRNVQSKQQAISTITELLNARIDV